MTNRNQESDRAKYSEPPELLSVVWRLTLIDRVASAELCRYPWGFEVRIMNGEELLGSQVHTNLHEAESDAAETFERLKAHGFSEALT